MVLSYRKDLYKNTVDAKDALLVVEVADSSIQHDRNIKYSLYAQAGIPEYWITDINNEVI